MKNPSKTLSVLLVSAVFLTACGGDKPAEPTPKAEPKTEAKSEPATTQAKPSEPKADEPQTDDKADTSKTETPQNDKADAPAEPAKDEPKKEEPKSEVKALSLEEGKARYEKTCKVCHEQGLLDAPKLSDKANWAKRLEKGIDILHAHSAKGFNKMPAQATGDVSEAEVYAAVDYMVSQAK